ncbi:MAG: cbb3-type cytochrome c oxidase subunit 3 [Gammaproteobacteria bacterium]|nr:cbb3-type cytochrome c oxidase subunit 3 [Gammaproteobacteria bacterium]
MGILRGMITLALLGAFAWLVIWLFVIRKPRDFDAAARIPLEDKRDGDSDE